MFSTEKKSLFLSRTGRLASLPLRARIVGDSLPSFARPSYVAYERSSFAFTTIEHGSRGDLGDYGRVITARRNAKNNIPRNGSRSYRERKFTLQRVGDHFSLLFFFTVLYKRASYLVSSITNNGAKIIVQASGLDMQYFLGNCGKWWNNSLRRAQLSGAKIYFPACFSSSFKRVPVTWTMTTTTATTTATTYRSNETTGRVAKADRSIGPQRS